MRAAAVAAAAAGVLVGAGRGAALECACSLPDESTWSRYNALMLGDGTSMAYAPDVAAIAAVDGLAYVLAAYPNEGATGACATSEGFVACLPAWLSRNWSSVHFNWGREDAAAGVDAADYAANMVDAFRLINASTPTVAWATTTPEPASSSVSNARIVELNDAADALFGDSGRFGDGVTENDLYDKVVAHCRLDADVECLSVRRGALT